MKRAVGGERVRQWKLTPVSSLPSEEKKGAGGGPVRLRSSSRKDSISEDEMVLRERSYDYQFRYCGHCNTTTDIKEANFFGRSEPERGGDHGQLVGSGGGGGVKTSQALPWCLPLGRQLHFCGPQ